uniref:Epithelial membrane protein 2 n=1 Tax=Phallusia mammillata TaxID=59560 RepID=A0A6F9DCR3_9ASCI|nr:epithelial membrane protein 2 [Phallusia mammillata]
MGKSVILSAVAAFLGMVGFVFILVAICTNNWLVESATNTGLWQRCTDASGCENFAVGESRIYRNYEMVRGFGVLAVTMVFLGLVVTLVNIAFRNAGVKIGASVMATLYLMGAFFGLTCVGLFTSLSYSSGTIAWGYSFGLGWASFPFALVAGGIMAYMELAMTA